MVDWEQPADTRRRGRGWAALGLIAAVLAVGLLGRSGVTVGPPDEAGSGTLDIEHETEPLPRPTPPPTPEPSQMVEPTATPTPEPVAIADGRWRHAPRPPVPLRHVPMVWSGDEVLFWGGERWGDERRRFFRDGAALDPWRRRWRRLPAAPLQPRAGHATVVFDGKLFVWGGEGVARFFADGAVYDPAKDTWQRVAPAPLSPRTAVAAVWTGEEILIFGGHDHAGSHTDMAAYDPATNTWRRIGRVPLPLTPLFRQGWMQWSGVVHGPQVIWYQWDAPPTAQAIVAYRPAENQWSHLDRAPVIEHGMLQVFATRRGLFSVIAPWDGLPTVARLFGTWDEVALPEGMFSLRIGIRGRPLATLSADRRLVYTVQSSDHIWEYDVTRQQWYRLTEAPTDGAPIAVATAGNGIVLFTGQPAPTMQFTRETEILVFTPR